MKHLAFTAALALVASAPALADVVYDNGAPNGLNGNDATLWLQTEDFTLATSTQLTGAGVYLGNYFGSTWDGSFTYYLFADGGGMPGALLQSANVAPTVTSAGAWSYGDMSLYEFGISSFDAVAGTTYWLGIHAAADFDSRDDIYWITTDPTVGNGTESYQGTMDNWASNGQEHAFYLLGSAEAVPEPATWALMVVGFGAIGLSMRRRKVTSVALA